MGVNPRRMRISNTIAGGSIPAALAIATLVSIGGLALAEESAQLERRRPIVFVSDRNGNEDIYAMNADGHDVRRITATPGESRGSWVPAWSPDESRIVFASNRDDGGSANLYTVNADGCG